MVVLIIMEIITRIHMLIAIVSIVTFQLKLAVREIITFIVINVHINIKLKRFINTHQVVITITMSISISIKIFIRQSSSNIITNMVLVIINTNR